MRTTKNETINDELTKKDILALDIATHTGYYSLHEGGTWNFTESKRKNNNKQHKDFRDTLMAFIQKYDIKQIVAEDVNVNNHFTDMRKLCEFRGILKEVCDDSICRNRSLSMWLHSKNGLPEMAGQTKRR